jgi:hypothetical protein
VNRKGWGELVAAYRAANPDSEQKERLEWYEHQCSNGDARGLGAGREFVFDKDEINRALAAKGL